jgi:molybdopterin-containing oxidoreductase family membrane subunit
MRLSGRDWAFYVQVLGLLAIWGVTFSSVGWFLWRARELSSAGDSATAALVLAAVVGAVYFTFALVLTRLFIALGAAPSVPATVRALRHRDEILVRSVLEPWSPSQKAVVAVLAAVTLFALGCWWKQLRVGLSVTGLGKPVAWGLYITNFVFFIGISYGGTLVSAILRIANGEWRRAITRAAEALAVLVLAVGGWNILLDMGRPDRAMKIALWGRTQSPLLWDVVAIGTYVIATLLYLYLPLIPDLALLRTRVTGVRRPLYHLLAFGWTGTAGQHQALERAISTIAVLIIPVAVAVHSVVAWVFSMTVQPLWHSTIFGPYFVLGAMFSGTAALNLVLALLRRSLHLGDFIRDVHFSNLGLLLLVLSALWLYFMVSENLTVAYGAEPREMSVLSEKLTGRFAPLFWTMCATCFVIPLAALARKRTVPRVVLASLSVCVGMWIERYTIVVPTLEQPRLPYPTASYSPSFVELALMAGGFSTSALLYVLFTRLFPVISLWEMGEGRDLAAEETAARVRAYFPPDSKRGASP